MQHWSVIVRIRSRFLLRLFGGLLRQHLIHRQTRGPSAITHPISVDLLGRYHGEQSCRLPVIRRLVDSLGLHCHGFRIGGVEAGIVEAVVNPDRNRYQSRSASRQKLNYPDGARAALGILRGTMVLIGRCRLLVMRMVLQHLGCAAHAEARQPHAQQCSHSLPSRFAV